MKLTAKTETFKEFIGIADGINALELRIHIEDDKVWYRVVDTGNVAMASVELPIDAFNEHTFTPQVFCIDVVKFKNVFGYGGKEIIINRESEESNVIVVESGGYKSSQTLLHETTVRKDPNMPALELPGVVEISGKELATAIKNISIEADKIKMIVADGVFTLESVNEGQDKTVKPFLSDELLHIEGEGNSLFSTDYLLSMSRNWSGSDVKVRLGIDHPVIVESRIAGGHGSSVFLLAPRIES